MDPTTWQAPFAVVVGALFVIVMLRANATYWLGRAIVAGTSRSRFSRVLDSRAYAVGARWIGRWGAPAIALSFLTVGIQTMVNLAAGVARMPMRRYLPSVTIGSIMWALLYGTVGFAGFIAIKRLWFVNPPLTVAVGVLMVAVLSIWLVRKRVTRIAAAQKISSEQGHDAAA